MSFKIGDKVIIHDGSWSIVIRGTEYDTSGVCGIMEVTGTVIATDCRLPIGPSCTGKNPTPTGGMPLALSDDRVMFQDLLVQTEDGFVFTSTRHVKLVPVKPLKYYAYIFGSIKMEITKKQYDEIEEAEKTMVGSPIPGLLEVENE